jgi:hypothetical protein
MERSQLGKRTMTCLLLSAILGALACSMVFTRVADIRKNPEKFENKSVVIRGTVTSATKLPFMEEGFYTLDDGTGQITVVTAGALPAEGHKRVVRGTIHSGFSVMGKSFGLTVREGG